MSSPLPPPRKKQKTAPSCDQNQDGKDDPLLASSEAPAVLTTELIARVASFASYGTDAINICLAVGPKDSAIVRYTCLRNNMKYLEGRLEQYVNEKLGMNQVTTYSLAWMAVNTDWRKLCTADNREKFAIVSIERENEAVTRQVNTLALFNNPSVAAEFDLVDVLKHLVEEVGIDINAYEWNSYEGPTRAHLLAASFGQDNCFQYLIKQDDLDVSSTWIHPEDKVYTSLPVDLFQLGFRMLDGATKRSFFQAIVCHASFDPNKPRRQEDTGPLGGPFRGLLLRPLQYALACIEDTRFGEDPDEMVERIKILLAKTDVDPSLRTTDCISSIDFAFERLMASAIDKEAYGRWRRIVSAMKQSHPDLVEQKALRAGRDPRYSAAVFWGHRWTPPN